MAEEHDSRSDEALVADAQGDDGAFLRLVARFRPRIRGFLAAQLTDPGALDLDDLAQQIFDAAYDGLARLQHPDLFWPWLCAIALHHLYDERGRRRPLVPLDALAAPPAAPAADDQITLLVEEDLAALGDAARPVLELYAQGYSVREIAARLGRGRAAVKRALSRGRRALRILYARDRTDRTDCRDPKGDDDDDAGPRLHARRAVRLSCRHARPRPGERRRGASGAGLSGLPRLAR